MINNLITPIESLLFIAAKPFTLKELAKLLDVKAQEVEAAVTELKAKYNQPQSGIWLAENKTLKDREVQFATNPESKALVEKFLKTEINSELTRPALETLTIIAYRGPMTKPEIEQIRGINCGLIIRNLLIKGLIEMSEKQKEPYYRISFDFLKHLGIKQLEELPDYDKLHQHESLEEYLNQKAEIYDDSANNQSHPR